MGTFMGMMVKSGGSGFLLLSKAPIEGSLWILEKGYGESYGDLFFVCRKRR